MIQKVVNEDSIVFFLIFSLSLLTKSSDDK